MSEEIKDEKNIAVDSADEKTANTTKNGDMQNVGVETSAKTGAETGSEPVHHRRHHYSGKYPKRFNEKYKELNADKYQDTVAKVRSKGSTPAGTHVPIMVKEIMDFLQIQPGQQGLDATLGYGGHSKEMLSRLNGGASVCYGCGSFGICEDSGTAEEHGLR